MAECTPETTMPFPVEVQSVEPDCRQEADPWTGSQSTQTAQNNENELLLVSPGVEDRTPSEHGSHNTQTAPSHSVAALRRIDTVRRHLATAAVHGVPDHAPYYVYIPERESHSARARAHFQRLGRRMEFDMRVFREELADAFARMQARRAASRL